MRWLMELTELPQQLLLEIRDSATVFFGGNPPQQQFWPTSVKVAVDLHSQTRASQRFANHSPNKELGVHSDSLWWGSGVFLGPGTMKFAPTRAPLTR